MDDTQCTAPVALTLSEVCSLRAKVAYAVTNLKLVDDSRKARGRAPEYAERRAFYAALDAKLAAAETTLRA